MQKPERFVWFRYQRVGQCTCKDAVTNIKDLPAIKFDVGMAELTYYLTICLSFLGKQSRF
jgi:hypothetical protein